MISKFGCPLKSAIAKYHLVPILSLFQARRMMSRYKSPAVNLTTFILLMAPGLQWVGH